MHDFIAIQYSTNLTDLEGTNWKPGGYCGEVQQYDDLLYILYFKDCAVFSLNTTGAFSDGIIRAVS